MNAANENHIKLLTRPELELDSLKLSIDKECWLLMKILKRLKAQDLEFPVDFETSAAKTLENWI